MAFEINLPAELSLSQKKKAALATVLPFIFWLFFLFITLLVAFILPENAESYGWLFAFVLTFIVSCLPGLIVGIFWFWGCTNTARWVSLGVAIFLLATFFIPAYPLAFVCLWTLSLKSENAP